MLNVVLSGLGFSVAQDPAFFLSASFDSNETSGMDTLVVAGVTRDDCIAKDGTPVDRGKSRQGFKRSWKTMLPFPKTRHGFIFLFPPQRHDVAKCVRPVKPARQQGSGSFCPTTSRHAFPPPAAAVQPPQPSLLLLRNQSCHSAHAMPVTRWTNLVALPICDLTTGLGVRFATRHRPGPGLGEGRIDGIGTETGWTTRW